MITAFATFENAVEAMKLGAADYLPKPFTPEQVRRAARRVVAANQIRKDNADLGARIIKIERPGQGDLCRTLYLTDTDIGGTNSLFHAINRNKATRRTLGDVARYR